MFDVVYGRGRRGFQTEEDVITLNGMMNNLVPKQGG